MGDTNGLSGLIQRLAGLSEDRIGELAADIEAGATSLLAANGGAAPEAARRVMARFFASAETVPVDIVAGEFSTQLGWGEGTPEGACVARLGAIAEQTMQGNDYHGPQHAIHVLSHTMRLSNLDHGAVQLTDRDRLLLLIAATAHDAAHDGTGNKGIPFRLEHVAADIAVGEMRKAKCFSAAEIDDVEALILATEPMQRDALKSCAQLGREGLEADGAVPLPAEMARIAQSPRLAVMAGSLSDADLGNSIAMGATENARMSERVGREMDKAAGREFNGVAPAATQFFLDNIATTGNAVDPDSSSLQEVRAAALGDNRVLPLHATTPAGRVLEGAMTWRPGVRLEGALHPDVVARVNAAAEAMSADGRPVRASLSQGRLEMVADDAKLVVTRKGDMMHYRSDNHGGWRLCDDPVRDLPAVVTSQVGFGKASFTERHVNPPGVAEFEPAAVLRAG